MTLITNSRINAFATCPRKHDLQYNQRIRPISKPYPLRFGTLVHIGLESWWKHTINRMAAVAKAFADAIQADTHDDYDQWDLIKATELLAGYDARWSADEWETIHVEHEFRLPILGQHTLGGKLDALARKRSTGDVYVIEHKTSSEDISPGSNYWRRLILDSQVSTYDRAAKDLGHGPSGVLYDVLSSDLPKPYKATPEEKRKYTKAGKLYANQREEDEPADEYRARVRAYIADNPDLVYQRATVARTEADEAEAREDLEFWAKAIIRGGYAAKNPKSCKTFGYECPYIPICTRVSSAEDRTLYYIAEDEHEELTTLPAVAKVGDEREVA